MRVIAVILAAGAGRRMGGAAKALLAIDGETFLGRITATVRAAGVSGGVVVVGAPHAAAVGAAARSLGFDVATNGDPARGMASSVAIGFTAAVSRDAYVDADVALLWPVDHPHVGAATIERLLAELAAAPDRVAAIPTRAGRGGHPPAIRRALWPALAACGARPDGARGVIAAVGPAAIRIEVDDDGVVRDIDEPGDLGG
jgi:CTP:molybdopterin cytidylyltransferase MocA